MLLVTTVIGVIYLLSLQDIDRCKGDRRTWLLSCRCRAEHAFLRSSSAAIAARGPMASVHVAIAPNDMESECLALCAPWLSRPLHASQWL